VVRVSELSTCIVSAMVRVQVESKLHVIVWSSPGPDPETLGCE